MVELREPDRRAPQLIGTEVARLRVELLDVERVLLETARRLLCRETLRLEGLARADAGDVAREDAGDARDRARARVARALQQRFGRLEHTGDVARAPGVGERE